MEAPCVAPTAIAESRMGSATFADFSVAGVAWFEEHAMTSSDYMATLPVVGRPLLPRTYGFDLRMLLVDFTHSDMMGVGGWLLAHVLIVMAKVGRSRDWRNLCHLHAGCL